MQRPDQFQMVFRSRFYFVLLWIKPLDWKIFCEPETKSQKNVNESVSNKISFLLEDEESSRANFNGKTMTFILVLIRNQV